MLTPKLFLVIQLKMHYSLEGFDSFEWLCVKHALQIVLLNWLDVIQLLLRESNACCWLCGRVCWGKLGKLFGDSDKIVCVEKAQQAFGGALASFWWSSRKLVLHF